MHRTPTPGVNTTMTVPALNKVLKRGLKTAAPFFPAQKEGSGGFLPAPGPSLLRRPLSGMLLYQKSLPCHTCNISGMLEANLLETQMMEESLTKVLRGYILLPPPPLFLIFLALYLHSAFKFDVYYLLSRCASPHHALPSVKLLF